MPLPLPIAPLAITAFTATTAVGTGLDSLLQALRDGRSGLRPNDFGAPVLPTWIGRVDGVEQVVLPAALQRWDCRNNRLAWLGLQADGFVAAVAQARQRHGAHRVALVLGTSTSSIGATEEAYTRLDAEGHFAAADRLPQVHTPHSLAMFVQEALALAGPCLTVSTACSSSAKVFADAERLLRLGLADAVVVGGVDTLCGSVLFGFNALELVSPEPCRPFDAARQGISLGEAAGFALLQRQADAPLAALLMLGYGEASDAHHMSTPHPQGLGAERALDDALARAGMADTRAIDYINLHGTASAKNDEVEAALVARRFAATAFASSTKGLVGHTLGAAGIVEAVVCLLALREGWMPGTVNTQVPDALCGPQIRLQGAAGPVRRALSNSFGFGGNNCVLVFGRADVQADIQADTQADAQTAAAAAAPPLAPASVATAALYVDAVTLWSPMLPGWDAAAPALRGEPQTATATTPARPVPQMLAPAERRRAPDTVALALVAGAAAVAAAGADAAALPSVFVSAHGDLGVNDYMCSTLAHTPLLLSPTRFHNSVHNAAAGYWTMATACHEASTALTAHERSFANGLLAAATQCLADGRAVLLVGYDVNAVGGLASVTRSEGLLAVALLLSPVRGAHSLARLDWQLRDGNVPAPPLQSAAAQSLAGNAMADALPLCELLAGAAAAAPDDRPAQTLNLPLSAQQALALRVTPLHPARPDALK